ncbi:berberine bridge enzyme-like 18 [Heracleum sosnowskyi]|uniref:Berberine bridge enzyme-like 18 n=1 Tax=Heracleum sosnowskyi TaxID=360622 RepID=A0AAD8I136_9APIA|nr:berberine bridge enzyme-like 18 [Heracleum sosnowskyi]
MTYTKLICLLLAALLATCNATHEAFVKCMSSHSSRSINSSDYIQVPGSPSYSLLLQSSQQNPRWVNSTSLRPQFIITPYTDIEIKASILCSRKHGLQVRILSGGHDYEGQSYRCKTPFIIINLINLRSVRIDLEEETAWVQSGTTLGEVYYNIAKKSKVHGFPAGSCPSVGIGGHFSGGGFGNMVRKYGLAADNVIDAYLIDVYGRILDRETMGKDLFWAIRGGGGASFGVIVSWKIKLVRVPEVVTFFNVHKKLEQGATELVHRWQYVAEKLPENLFIRVMMNNAGQVNNKAVLQASFQSLFLGEVSELMSMMRNWFPELGLQVENCTEMTWIESALWFAGYTEGQSWDVLLTRTDQYKSNFKAKSDFVTKPIPKSGLEGIWKRMLEVELAFVILEPFGGRMAEISESEIPFPHRKGNLYNVQYLLKWDVNNDKASEKHIEWIWKLYKYMKLYVSHSPRTAYQNYRDFDLGINKQPYTNYNEAALWGSKYFKSNFRKLAQVKTKADPLNFFRHEQSIPLIRTPKV